MAVEDDFSFPTTMDHFSRCGIDSPPLWRVSPASSPISCRETAAEEKSEDRFALQRRRRRSSLSSGAAAEGGGGEEETAEKMDVLWENFNEELSRSRRSRMKNKSGELESMEEIVKAAELKLSESSGTVATTRKTTGKTVIAKVLKKLFLLHNNSRRNLQTRSR